MLKMSLPHVIIDNTHLAAPEGIGRRVWRPAPGSHLWSGDLLRYLWWHFLEAASIVLILLGILAVLAVIMLTPLWA